MKGIKYKDVTAMPGSELHDRLSDASTKSGKDRGELLKKAEKCYNACIQRHRRSIGELAFNGWEIKED